MTSLLVCKMFVVSWFVSHIKVSRCGLLLQGSSGGTDPTVVLVSILFGSVALITAGGVAVMGE